MDFTEKPSGRARRPIAERFWEKVRKGRPNECWEWQAARNEKGYGRLTAGRGVHLKAHRVAWALSNGCKLEPSACILHRCDNPPCCNPRHLFVGTMKDNTDDMIKKGRNSNPPHRYGENHHAAKFDERTAKKIIRDNRTLSAIAEEHGISWMTVFRLKHGLTWKNLK